MQKEIKEKQILLPKCTVFDFKRSIFIKKQETSSLLRNLGLKLNLVDCARKVNLKGVADIDTSKFAKKLA